MSRKCQIGGFLDNNGLVRGIPPESVPEDTKTHHYKEPQDIIDFCMHCEKENCNGFCSDYRRFIKERRKKKKDGET